MIYINSNIESIQDISEEKFIEDFYNKKIPLRVTGSFKNENRSVIGFQYMYSKCYHRSFKFEMRIKSEDLEFEHKIMTFGEFYDKYQAKRVKDQEEAFLNDFDISKINPNIQSEIILPEYKFIREKLKAIRFSIGSPRSVNFFNVSDSDRIIYQTAGSANHIIANPDV